MLVEYEGNCPEDAVEINFDYQSVGTGIVEDVVSNDAIFTDRITDKTQRFGVLTRLSITGVLADTPQMGPDGPTTQRARWKGKVPF